MNLSSLYACGHAAPQSAAAAVAPAAPRPPASPEAEEPEGRDRPRGGGQVRDALVQAFQSLGIELPRGVAEGRRHEEHHGRHHGHDEHEHRDGHGDDHRTEGLRHRSPPVASAPAEPAAGASEPAEGSAEAAPAAAVPAAPVTARTLRSDLHDFMHELFQAIRGAAEASATPVGDVQPTDAATAVVPATPPGSRLAIGLTALVSQVGAGQAPASLQGAFDQLMNDLAAFGGNASTDTSVSAATPPSLQQVLGALQQRLGYGSSANDSSALGNTIDLAA